MNKFVYSRIWSISRMASFAWQKMKCMFTQVYGIKLDYAVNLYSIILNW